MNYNEFKSRIKYLLYDDIHVATLLGAKAKFFRDTIEDIMRHIEKFMSTDNYSAPEDSIRRAKIIGKDLITSTVVEKLEDTSREFISLVSLLLDNFAKATKDEEMKKIAQGLAIMLEFSKSVLLLIEACRIFYNVARQFQDFKPKAFEISELYLRQLYEEINKGVNTHDRNK